MKNPIAEFWEAQPNAEDNSPLGATRRLRELLVGTYLFREAVDDLDLIEATLKALDVERRFLRKLRERSKVP